MENQTETLTSTNEAPPAASCLVCGNPPGDNRHWTLEPYCSRECARVAYLARAILKAANKRLEDMH